MFDHPSYIALLPCLGFYLTLLSALFVPTNVLVCLRPVPLSHSPTTKYICILFCLFDCRRQMVLNASLCACRRNSVQTCHPMANSLLQFQLYMYVASLPPCGACSVPVLLRYLSLSLPMLRARTWERVGRLLLLFAECRGVCLYPISTTPLTHAHGFCSVLRLC